MSPEDGDLLLAGIIDTFPLIGQWRQPFCNRQTPADIPARETRISKTMAHTLEQLEDDVWPAPDVHTSLIDTCHRLRRVPIDSLAPSDIRILLGQRIGVRHLVPLAIDILDADPLIDASHFPGDLLTAVLRADENRFRGFPVIRNQLTAIAARARRIMSESNAAPVSHQELSALLTEYER